MFTPKGRVISGDSVERHKGIGFKYGFGACGALACSHNAIGAYVSCCLYRLPQGIEMMATDFTGGYRWGRSTWSFHSGLKLDQTVSCGHKSD